MVLGQWEAILGPMMNAIGGASTVPTQNVAYQPQPQGPSPVLVVGLGLGAIALIGLVVVMSRREEAPA